MKWIILLLIFCSLVNSQWNGNQALVLDEDGFTLAFNGETTGATDPGTFDTLTIPLSLSAYNSITFEFWIRPQRIFLNGQTPTPRQTIFFYGIDQNNYIWVSLANGTDGSMLTPPTSEFRIKSNGNTPLVIPFKALDGFQSWTHFAISLQPSTSGMSFVKGIGFAGKGVPVYFNAPATTSTFVGNTQLIIGKLSDALQAELLNPVAYGGRIGEIRIWNSFMTEAQLNTSQYTSLSGTESGLIHRWKFDEGATNSPTIVDSVGTSNGALTGTTYVAREGSNNPPNSFSDMIPFYQFPRVIPANGNAVIKVGTNSFATLQTLTLATIPASGTLVDLINQVTVGQATLAANNQTLNKFAIQYTPSRVSCGTVQQLSGSATAQRTPSNSFFSQITVQNLAGTTLTASMAPTTGGTITISGNVGANGQLLANENVTIVFPTFSLACTNGAVNLGALTCTVPQGVGAGATLIAVLCGSAITVPAAFSYMPPTISTVSFASQAVSIVGNNFGPSRVFDNVADRVTITTSAGTVYLCNVTVSSFTSISCSVSVALSQGSVYTATVTIGGQTASKQTNHGVHMDPSSMLVVLMVSLICSLYK